MAAHYLSLQEAGRILAKTYKIRVTVIPDAVQALPKSKVGIRELLVPAYRKRLLLMSCIAVMGAIEYYTVGFNLPRSRYSCLALCTSMRSWEPYSLISSGSWAAAGQFGRCAASAPPENDNHRLRH